MSRPPHSSPTLGVPAMCDFVAPPRAQDCPFSLNQERWGSQSDRWPGGFFVEVLMHGEPGYSFWERHMMVEVAFPGLQLEFRHDACDENVEIASTTRSSITVRVKRSAQAQIQSEGVWGRFGCAVQGLNHQRMPTAHEIQVWCRPMKQCAS